MRTERLSGFSDGVIAIIITIAIYAFVALIWLIPDRRIEKAIAER